MPKTGVRRKKKSILRLGITVQREQHWQGLIPNYTTRLTVDLNEPEGIKHQFHCKTTTNQPKAK